MSGRRSQTFRIKRAADYFKRSGDKLGVGVSPPPTGDPVRLVYEDFEDRTEYACGIQFDELEIWAGEM